MTGCDGLMCLLSLITLVSRIELTRALHNRQQVSEVLNDDEAEADKTIDNVYPGYHVKYDIPGIAKTHRYRYASTDNIFQPCILGE